MIKRNKCFTQYKNIPEDIHLQAELRASNLPIFEKSHRGNQANEIGCLGEVIAEKWMSSNGIIFNPNLEKTTHDYIVNETLTIDVKTKDRTVRPKLDYDNSAPLYNHLHQRPDYFLFISLERNKKTNKQDIRKYHTAYIVGSISYEEIDKIGIPFLEGDEDWRNGTKFWTDCLNVEMWQLIPLRETIEIFKGQRNNPSQAASVNNEIVKEMGSRIKKEELLYRKLPSY